jgi:hypothetical protein
MIELALVLLALVRIESLLPVGDYPDEPSEPSEELPLTPAEPVESRQT